MAKEWGGHYDIVLVLLRTGVDVNARDLRGRTALTWAMRADYSGIVRLLKKAGAKEQLKETYSRNGPLSKKTELQHSPTEF